ncbi:MAG: hypothetical protein GX629_10330 [Phycisphaerae bacterium]|jgi:hypothetical protein|nr:hypothetical protein [Phycisphaerae bacterium]
MFKQCKYALLCMLTSTTAAMAQKAADPQEVLIPEQSIILPWIVGLGIFAAVLIVGFKHSGRTHLD